MKKSNRPDASNRRSSARTPVCMLVHTDDGRDPIWAWDLGLGGLRCNSSNLRMPGDFLNVRFALPGESETYKVKCQITSLDGDVNGSSILSLRFCATSARLTMALYRFLDRRRALWSDTIPDDGDAFLETVEHTNVVDLTEITGAARPFEGMMLHAWAALCEERKAQRAYDEVIAKPEENPMARGLGRDNGDGPSGKFI